MILKEYRGPPVQFYAVSCTANRNLCRAHQIDGYPRIFLFAENAAVNATADVTYWKLHAFDVLDKLGVQVPQLRLDVSETNSEAALGISQTEAKVPVTGAFNSIAAFNRLRFRNPKGTIVPDVHNQRTKQQVFDDAYRSFDFNLRNGIFLKEGPLTNATQMALRDWLDLVKQTTPVVWQTHTVINAILADFDQAVRSEENLIKIIDRFPPPSPKWSLACTKGVVGMGYTCGLWQLFHIISVGVVEYNLMIPAADDTVLVELTLPTTHAAETLRNFVEHFFGCDVCRLNFLKAYDSCAFDRCNRLTANEMNGDQWILFPIWLFETHNAVNARLFREKADRENRLATPAEEVATQWPAKNVCPKCWLDSGGWDEESVYKYLRTEYW